MHARRLLAHPQRHFTCPIHVRLQREKPLHLHLLQGRNLHKVVAQVAGVVFTVHGVAGSLDPGLVAAVSENMYKFVLLLSSCIGAVAYYVLCLIWPA